MKVSGNNIRQLRGEDLKNIIIPFKEETYNNYINRILNSRDNIKDSDNYQEKHHILPKCLGSTNSIDNLIYLYGQEHYYAHKLLALENPDSSKLNYAWWNMCHCNVDKREVEISSDDYNQARENFSRLISNNFSGRNAYWYGKHQSDTSRKKRSLSESGEGNPMYGKHHSQESIEKMRHNRKHIYKGAEHPKSRMVCCLNTGEVFCSETSATQWANLKSRSSITQCCKGYKNSAGKHPITKEKLFWSYVDDGDMN